MTDTQPSDTDACAATDGPPFRFMDLPAEIREMIYHHAMRQGMIVESTRRPFHFLLSVCSLIRKEASPIYFRVSRFALKLQPQPHTELTVLAFDRDTRNWFDLIGADRINDLRHVFFVFHNAKDQTHSARICVMDLWPFIDHHWRSPNNSLGALPAAYWITVSTEAQRASGITTIMAELVIVYSKFGRKGRVPEFEELSERGRLVRMRFEDCLSACLARKICRKQLGLLTHHQFNPEETSLRPNSRNIKKLRDFLR